MRGKQTKTPSIDQYKYQYNIFIDLWSRTDFMQMLSSVKWMKLGKVNGIKIELNEIEMNFSIELME